MMRGEQMPQRPSALTVKQITVTGVDTEAMTAMVRDQLGKEFSVGLTMVRTPYTPATGDRWIIDQTLGVWSFAAKIVTQAAGLPD